IELFVSNGELDFPEKTVPALVADVLAAQPRVLKGASDGFIAEITVEAVTLSRVVAEQIRKGGFTECRTEVPFGGAGAVLAGGEIRLPHGAAAVEGVIDRLDVAKNGGQGAARVIDYKTGYAAFSYADIYYGKKLQLPVYLAVARANGYAPAGMFYFPFSSGFSDENDHRLLGVFDSAYALEMDRDLALPSHASSVVRARSTKDSSADKVTLAKSGNAAVTGDTLASVCDYARAALDAGAKEMFGGYIAAAPLSGGNISECAYCEMYAACAAMGGVKRERKKGRVSADDFVRIRGEL
ncbi:MAG: PD-(D/E)XK nuclease family protein, partial [Clostridiales bacterium]|nr:PD-(D/E)XK nuclease family protein [Clostridiales bacterium]